MTGSKESERLRSRENTTTADMTRRVKREALQKLNRKANEGRPGFDTERPN